MTTERHIMAGVNKHFYKEPDSEYFSFEGQTVSVTMTQFFR